MDTTALLSRNFTISFHIIFPAFTTGHAAWLTLLEALHLRTSRPVYRNRFDFWLKIFGVVFGFGVSGVVPVRHQLERAAADVGTPSRITSLLRNLHRVHAGSHILWHLDFWSPSHADLPGSEVPRLSGKTGSIPFHP
jgi:hypothetical protein